MKTSAQDSLDYDNRDYLVNVQKDCMRSSIPNTEMTMHRFFVVPRKTTVSLLSAVAKSRTLEAKASEGEIPVLHRFRMESARVPKVDPLLQICSFSANN
jgi:hypothetical protein